MCGKREAEARPGADLDPPDPRCLPGEADTPPACLCDLDECSLALCDGPRELRCPAAPYHCSKLDPADPRAEGVCREGRPEPRRLCRGPGDCVPEECEVPTFCVNAAAAGCQSRIAPGSEEGRPAIVGCDCVGGVCVTDYAFD